MPVAAQRLGQQSGLGRFADAVAAFRERTRALGAPWNEDQDYGAYLRSLDPADARHLAGLFAAHAAVTLFGAQRVDDLERALASRDEIGQAKGILMERFSLDPTDAFALLSRSSQDTNVKLRDVARWLVSQVSERSSAGAGPVHDVGSDRDRNPSNGSTRR